MKESKRIAGLFKNLYAGDPWIDVTITATLEGISAKDAAAHSLDKCNSIWQLVNHIISWRLNVLRRVQGEIITTPSNNYITEIVDASDAAWKETLQQLEESQEKWLAFLESFQEEDFPKIYPNNEMDYYEHIHGIIQHDAYHLGQIVLLAKYLN
ncbi:MAG: DinB family protein [Flavobacterium sp.]|uniref:DinB family protein n=1 Tax=Flavobacterium sp. TaxID=239 RepID=UPI0032655B6C